MSRHSSLRKILRNKKYAGKGKIIGLRRFLKKIQEQAQNAGVSGVFGF